MPARCKEDKYFLPLSHESAEALARILPPLNAEALAQYTTAGLAAVLLIQNIPLLSQTSKGIGVIERSLAELISAGQQIDTVQEASAFASLVAERFNPTLFNQGLDMLGEMRIDLLAPEDVKSANYLTTDGAWDFEFRRRHSARVNPYTEIFQMDTGREFLLTSPQARVFRVFETEYDEPMHVQALAGTGKTHMISTLLECLSQQRPIVLAYTKIQLDALRARLGGGLVNGITFGDLAKSLLEQNQTKSNRRVGFRGKLAYQVSDESAAKMLGLQSVGTLQSARVAHLCRRAVMSFCSKGRPCIEADDFPQIDQSLSVLDWAVLVQYANQFWQQTIEPTDLSMQLPIRGYHRIKHLSLVPELVLDGRFTHIIVDESHDLSVPMLQFLDRCRQPAYTLGDVCQRLDGLACRRAAHIRQREVSLSVRAGRQIEEVLNPLIEAHPLASVEPFVGSRERTTRVRYYDRPQIPDRPTTILVKSEWGLFEWFQRLGNGGARFSLLPGAERNFRGFVLDCIELYHRGVPPKHPALSRFSTWEGLAAKFSKTRVFEKIESMLQKGYKSSDFERSLMMLAPSGAASIHLGRVEDARNMELDSVMLAPDLLTSVKKGDINSASSTFAALYTGGSRARFELIVPGYIRDWAADQAASAKPKP